MDKDLSHLEASVGEYKKPETVDHPNHYNNHPSGVECIDVVEHMSFNLGNAMKYIWRWQDKNGVEDLEKAKWYLVREIARLKNETH